MQRTLLFSVLFVFTAIALACSGEESAPKQTATHKTPEQIAELEAECIKSGQAKSAEDLDAIAECLEKARQ